MVEEVKEEVGPPEGFEAAKERANDYLNRYTYLGTFKQVPRRTAEDFKKLADEEFSGHYGFALKALMDQLVVQRESISEARLDELEERLSVVERLSLQATESTIKENVRKTLSGRVINGV